MHQRRQSTVAVDGFGTAAQNRGIAGLDAQAGGVYRYVGTRFVDDADDTQRHTHLADLYAGRAVLHVADLADRVGQRGDLFQAFGHGCDGFLAECEAIQHGGFHAVGARSLHVLAIGGEQRILFATDCGSDGQQRLVLDRGVGFRHLSGCSAGALPELLHVVLDVHSCS